MYRKYIQEILFEVTNHSYFRELFLNKEPFEIVDLDVTNSKYYTPWVTAPCIKYGLRYLGYKNEGEDGNPNACLLIIVAKAHDNIFRVSYNNFDYI